MCEFSVVCWWYQFQTFWSHGCQGRDSEEGGEKLQHPLDLTLEESLAHLARDFEMNAGEREGNFFSILANRSQALPSLRPKIKRRAWERGCIKHTKAIVLQSLATIYLSLSCHWQLTIVSGFFRDPGGGLSRKGASSLRTFSM